MKLLISVLDEKEALEAYNGGADIIDVKNPLEGSLGASPPRIVKAVKNVLPKKTEVSVAVGDVPDLPGTVSLAVLGAAQLKVDYIKIGLYGPKTVENAYRLVKEAWETIKKLEPKITIPMHYWLPGTTLPLKTLDEFLGYVKYKVDRVDSNTIEVTKESLPEEPKVIVLKYV